MWAIRLINLRRIGAFRALLAICFLLTASGIQAADLINEGFDNFDTGTRPAGWTFTNCNNDTDTWTSAGYYGVASPSVVWKGTSGVITTETFANPGQLQFWTRGSGTQVTSSLLIEEFYAASWNPLTTISPLPTAETTEGPFALNSGTTQLSFAFSYYSGEGNVGIDDVSVTSAVTPTPSPYVVTPTPTPYITTPTPILDTPTPTPTVAPADIVINEVAWMGTVYSSDDQWLELYNNTAAPITLNDWTLEGFSGWTTLSGIIEANSYFLLESTEDTVSDIPADMLLSWTLSYYGERLRLWNTSSEVVDDVDCAWGWFAGSASDRKTMERINPTKPGLREWNWATWNATTWNGHDGGGNQINGTARALNSVFRLYTTPTPTPRVPTPTPTPTTTPSTTPTSTPLEGPISGRVYDKISGTGVAEVYMRALAPTGIGSDITDSLGDYEITGLAAGFYRIMADPALVPGDITYCVQYYYRTDNFSAATWVPTNSSGIDFSLIRDVPTPTRAPTPTPVATPPPLPDRDIVLGSGDYNGDGTSDIAVFRPGAGMWAVRNLTKIYYGSVNDIPAPADYNGDGTTDFAFFRLASGLWAIRNISWIYFGRAADIPVPADYNGDGVYDVGVFRPPNGLWAIKNLTRTYFGCSLDQAVPGDYDGDGCSDIAVFRDVKRLWALKDIGREYFGAAGDEAVPADYNGDGITDIAVFRSYYSSLWAVKNITRAYPGQYSDSPWPAPADYDGNGEDQICVFHATYGKWSVQDQTRVYFGRAGDLPVTR